MMPQSFVRVLLLGFLLSQSGCSMGASDEIVILLPGQVKGKPLVLAETSASNISINRDLVPSLIVKVWWNDSLIITENHPMKLRSKFPGDTYQIPDRTVSCWYLIHPQTDAVLRIHDRDDLQDKIRQFGVDPQSVDLQPLRRAQALREEELGVSFTASSVNRYLQSQRQGNRAQGGQ